MTYLGKTTTIFDDIVQEWRINTSKGDILLTLEHIGSKQDGEFVTFWDNIILQNEKGCNFDLLSLINDDLKEFVCNDDGENTKDFIYLRNEHNENTTHFIIDGIDELTKGV